MEKTIYFASGCQLNTASWLGLGACVYFPLLVLGLHLAWTRMDPLHATTAPCACCHSLCEFMCVSVMLCLEDTVSLASSIFSGSMTTRPPLLHSSLSPDSRGLMKASFNLKNVHCFTGYIPYLKLFLRRGCGKT